ncbi:hypothetical protein BB021_10945 [Elizabethkingia ursingii]|uniref:Uncharacterized protein n=1 Tax=Elizabethkingia ursingii TaxID=1756150 RepID=A0ABX3N793_9FLAO|nr:hypothetical protein BB021_10945 [Elizabethkingia ursingii]
MAGETKAYTKIPTILSFKDNDCIDTMKEEIKANYNQIKLDLIQTINQEMECITNDPDLQHLFKTK